jgi:single-stranded DNA-binding protein
MFCLNRITLVGYTGGDAQLIPNGPTTLTLATNTMWTDPQTRERRTRTEWHQLVVMWNSGQPSSGHTEKGGCDGAYIAGIDEDTAFLSPRCRR